MSSLLKGIGDEETDDGEGGEMGDGRDGAFARGRSPLHRSQIIDGASGESTDYPASGSLPARCRYDYGQPANPLLMTDPRGERRS